MQKKRQKSLNKMAKYLNNIEMASLVEAIKKAEEATTGEIRLHIDTHTKDNHAKAAFNVFTTLGMAQTKERNAVLFHVNFEKKYLTIIGDEGIHEKVQQKFWDDLHDKIIIAFSQQNYFKGLYDAILETGQKLKKHFPVRGENPNELSNEITFS